MRIRQLFESLIPRQMSQQQSGSSNLGYGRTAVNGVLRHNDRINTVQRLMHSYQNVDRFLREQNSDERALIKHIEEQEKQAAAINKPEEAKSPVENEEKKEQGKKWKQKFIKIWQYNEMLEQTGQKGGGGEENEQVGPKNFMPIMKLGQGSFGQVFLVEKINIKPDGT